MAALDVSILGKQRNRADDFSHGNGNYPLQEDWKLFAGEAFVFESFQAADQDAAPVDF
jgi:hypothetical protein